MKERYSIPIMTVAKLLVVTVSIHYLFSCSSPDKGSQRLDSEIVFHIGLGWTQDRLEEKRMANRHELDAVSRDVPISFYTV